MRYACIYVDVPWRYSDKRIGRGGCEAHYDTLTPSQARSLPVQQMARENCALFAWATMPLLPLAIDVMRCWGFRFVTTAFVWIKRGDSGKLAVGNGAYTRANAELVMLGVRGSPKVASHSVQSVIEAPRREHSAKPPEVRERIVKLMGDVPRIELFAREAAPGWSRWGLEAPAGDGLVTL